MPYLTLIIVAVAGIIFGYYFAKRTYFKNSDVGRLNLRGVSKINTKNRENREEGKQKILKLLQSKQSIRNNDVEKLIGVSDATATRYLDELEAENKIKAQSAGRGTYYILR